jgi:hypothetical protein
MSVRRILLRVPAVPNVATRSLVTQHTIMTGIRVPHDVSHLFTEPLPLFIAHGLFRVAIIPNQILPGEPVVGDATPK